MHNIIFLECDSAEKLRQALTDWLDLYKDNFKSTFAFELFKNGTDRYVIKAGDRLDNEHFNYLFNYLVYPIDIKYKVKATGYITVSRPSVFPANTAGKELMVFIPETDKHYDRVYWNFPGSVTFTTDWEGNTEEAGVTREYEAPSFDLSNFPPPEIFYNSRHEAGVDTTVDDPMPDKRTSKWLSKFNILIGVVVIAIILWKCKAGGISI
jgi:hypothetical protein